MNQNCQIYVAPMVDITNIFFRNFFRLLTRETVLYTEMKTEAQFRELIEGQKRCRFSEEIANFSQVEHPVCIQLGGNNPEILAKCAQISEQSGYDEVNLNCGCPCQKVKGFGAYLMLNPKLVAEIVQAITSSSKVALSVKCRLGVDDNDSYEELCSFITTVQEAGCNHFIIHARKAILNSINPKQNRKIPPLKPEWVFKLQQDFPTLRFTINGEIRTFEQIENYLKQNLSVMIGRAAFNNP